MNYEGRLLSTGQAVRLQVEQGRIKAVDPLFTEDLKSLVWLAPGLIDLQVNGFADVDYNADGLNKDTLYASCEALWAQATTRFLPTLITNSYHNLLKLFANLKNAVATMSEGSVLGYHLEGPFISAADGARGAHPLEHARAPSLQEWYSWQKESGDAILLVTLAAEWAESKHFIQTLVAEGRRIALGHTAASVQQIESAVLAGASLSTHLGNGCHTQIHRHNHYLWAQLANDNLWASIIADGFHLPKDLLKIFLKMKSGKVFVVSDATRFAGMEAGIYETPVGGRVELQADGRLHLAAQKQLLAGSAQSQYQALQHLVASGLTTWSQAWDLASFYPAQYLSLNEYGSLAVGKKADIVLLEPPCFSILETHIAGKRVFYK